MHGFGAVPALRSIAYAASEQHEESVVRAQAERTLSNSETGDSFQFGFQVATNRSPTITKFERRTAGRAILFH